MLRAFIPERDECRDAVDHRWTALLADCGLVPLLLPNEPSAAKILLERIVPMGAVLTGGGDCSAISGRIDPRDETERVVLDWAFGSNRPVLGVCRGMQVLLANAGARLEPVSDHIASCHPVQTENATRLVNSYHSYAAKSAPGFHVMARAEGGVVEWIRKEHPRQEGIMWHPEREQFPAQADIELIRTLFLGP
jgi:N5-(cytidine 5'-diphosphoramidyl)-L-glutamine hydrolase